MKILFSHFTSIVVRIMKMLYHIIEFESCSSNRHPPAGDTAIMVGDTAIMVGDTAVTADDTARHDRLYSCHGR